MTDDRIDEDEGGESACFAQLLCPECGIVLDGAQHLESCTWEGSDADPGSTSGFEVGLD